MSILDAAYTFFAGTTVVEKNKVIVIDGIRTPIFTLDLQNKWRTNAVSQYFFKKIRRLSLEFNSFFAPDMYYILNTLIDDRKTRSNRNMLRDALLQLKSNTWLAGAFAKEYKKRLDYSALDGLTVTMLSHQMQFLKTYEEMTARWRLNGYILGAAPGSGKTITGIALAECLRADVVIYVVPKNSVERVWADTLSWVFKEKQSYWYSTSGQPIPQNCKHYVVHYEQLEAIVNFFRTNHKGKKIVVILDESHNLNDLTSQRTNLFIELCTITQAEDVLWSSGTPIKAMGKEVIPILRTIDPFFTAEEEDRFKKIFGMSTARALDILAHRLGLMTFKVDKDKVVGNTVLRYRVDVQVPDSKRFTLAYIKDEMATFVRERLEHYKRDMPAYIKAYKAGLDYYEQTLVNNAERQAFSEYRRKADSMHRGYDPYVHKTEPAECNAFEKQNIIPRLPKDLKEKFLEARSVYKYVELKVRGEALGRVLGKRRTECNVEMVKQWDKYKVTDLQNNTKYDDTLVDIVLDSTNKTVIFTSYVEVVDAVAGVFTSNKMKPLKVYGETNHELPRIVNDFGRNKALNPLVATLQSLSTAVPLVMANTAVFLNAPFRIHEYEQACSRIDRLGQPETVHIFDVYLDTGEEANISTRSLDIMAWSKEIVDQLLGKAGSASIALENFDDIAATEDLREDLWEPVTRSIPTPKVSAAVEEFSW